MWTKLCPRSSAASIVLHADEKIQVRGTEERFRGKTRMCVDGELRQRFGGGETARCEQGRRLIDYEPLCINRGGRHASAPAVNADHDLALLLNPNEAYGCSPGTLISSWGMGIYLGYSPRVCMSVCDIHVGNSFGIVVWDSHAGKSSGVVIGHFR